MRTSELAAVLTLLLAVGLPLPAAAGPGNDVLLDRDGDGVRDEIDNCLLVANPNQDDLDHDGCGDGCEPDCDLTGDGLVGGPDFVLFTSFIATEGFPCTGGCSGDCTGDGNASGPDIIRISQEFGDEAGPSCNESPVRDLSQCPLPQPEVCFPDD